MLFQLGNILGLDTVKLGLGEAATHGTQHFTVDRLKHRLDVAVLGYAFGRKACLVLTKLSISPMLTYAEAKGASLFDEMSSKR